MADNLAEFIGRTNQIVESTLDEARMVLQEAVESTFQEVLEKTPEFKSTGRDKGRYKASHRVGIGMALEDEGEPPGHGPYSVDYSQLETAVGQVQLGDTISYWNNAGFGESSGKSVSLAFFVEYGSRTSSAHHVYENASQAAEANIAQLVDSFSRKIFA